MQTTYNFNQFKFLPGQIFGFSARNIISRAAEEDLPYGYAVAYGTDKEKQCTNLYKERATLVFNADFVASNTINLKINGVSISQVTFTTDHDTTAGLVASAIDALSGVTCILDPSDANNRTFLITVSGADASVTDVVVAAGASQAVGTTTYSTIQTFAGATLHFENEEGYYPQYEEANVMRKGSFVGVLTTGQTPSVGQAVYAISSGADRGKFTTSSSGTVATGATFASTAVVENAITMAIVEINLP